MDREFDRGRVGMTGRNLERAAGEAAPVIDRVARLGFGTKGVVTILVGVLALQYALGKGGVVTGPSGAIQSLLDEPFARVILALLAVGLAGYALWMFVAAIVDPERKGRAFQGIAERVGFFVTGVGYALLAYATVKLLFGKRGEVAMGLDDLAARVLTPWVGRSFVGLVGLTVMIAGLLQLRLGLTARFRDSLRGGLSRVEQVVLVGTGSAGYVTLGVLSLLVGSSLVHVAIDYDPSAAGGWDQALWLLARLGEGHWLLGAAAVGLILYGLYFVLLARYRSL